MSLMMMGRDEDGAVGTAAATAVRTSIAIFAVQYSMSQGL